MSIGPRTPCKLAADEDVVDAIVRELQNTGQVRVRFWGRSMLPWVWPGASLVVHKSEAEEVTVGDLVMFERMRELRLHRAVQTAPSLVTQGDALSGPDGSGRVLGRVSQVVVGRLSVECPRPVVRAFNVVALQSAPFFRRFEPTLRRSARSGLQIISRLPWLRQIRAGLWSGRVEVLSHAHLRAIRPYLLSRGIRPTAAVLADWMNAADSSALFAAVAVVEGRIIGSLLVGSDGLHENTLRDIFVSRRYRGIGIGSRLIALAMEEARRREVVRIYADVPDGAHLAARLLQRKGFVEMSAVVAVPKSTTRTRFCLEHHPLPDSSR